MAIPKSGPIKFSDIVAQHRKKMNNLSQKKISGYYRNGGNVTDIYDNRNIPSYSHNLNIHDYFQWSNDLVVKPPTLKFSDFYGTGLQSEYFWPIPELCTDDFIGLAKGIGSWNQVSDSKTEYIGRNNTDPNSTTAASMEIPVYNPEGATITIPALSFEIGSERGPDMHTKRILKNT